MSLSIKDCRQEKGDFFNRILFMVAVVACAALVLLGRAYKLQVIDHEQFSTLSADNRLRLTPIPPIRGLVYDRSGRLLAGNQPSFSLEMIPEKVADIDATLNAIAAVIDLKDSDLENFQRELRQARHFNQIPVKTRLSEREVALFSVVNHQFPGIVVQAGLDRYYPRGESTGHVVGYVARISIEDLDRIDTANYRGSSHIGRRGLESSYEGLLHGSTGHQRAEVNAFGRTVKVVEEQLPVPGLDIHLYLDARLQEAALEALADYNGSVVAINPKTGGVLVMASKPGYNPNLFVQGISLADYQALSGSTDKPLYNRAVLGQYPPGSTVKPFVALGGLHLGVTTPGETTYCPGFFRLPNHTHRYRDWKKTGHGRTDMETAVVQSCDVYFYDLANRMGIDRFAQFMDRFGFGRRSGLDLTGERSGVLPSREWKRQTINKPWYPGETLIAGIGQGYFLITPMQLATATAILANRGQPVLPRLVEYAARADGVRHPLPTPELPHPDEINSQHMDKVIDAMIQVVEGQRGTARRIRTPAYRIAGKTGTAQVFTVGQDEEYDEKNLPRHLQDHALFIAFAPAEDPTIAIAVVVEHGGHGGSVAAPIARKIMDLYLLNN